MKFEPDCLVRSKNPNMKFTHARVLDSSPLAGREEVVVVVAVGNDEVTCSGDDLEMVANKGDLVEATERSTGIPVRGKMRECYQNDVWVVSSTNGETKGYHCIPSTVKRCQQPIDVTVRCRDGNVAKRMANLLHYFLKGQGFENTGSYFTIQSAPITPDTPISITCVEVKS